MSRQPQDIFESYGARVGLCDLALLREHDVSLTSEELMMICGKNDVGMVAAGSDLGLGVHR